MRQLISILTFAVVITAIWKFSGGSAAGVAHTIAAFVSTVSDALVEVVHTVTR